MVKKKVTEKDSKIKRKMGKLCIIYFLVYNKFIYIELYSLVYNNKIMTCYSFIVISAYTVKKYAGIMTFKH